LTVEFRQLGGSGLNVPALTLATAIFVYPYWHQKGFAERETRLRPTEPYEYYAILATVETAHSNVHGRILAKNRTPANGVAYHPAQVLTVFPAPGAVPHRPSHSTVSLLPWFYPCGSGTGASQIFDRQAGSLLAFS